jgi:RNA polymerase sigma-70 factor, ECF subfamily
MSDTFLPPDDLVRRLRDGNSSAAAEVVSEFTRRMLALARSRFDEALRPKEDPEDVVQSAFKSFFRGCSEGKLSPGGKEELWGLLALITLRKCRQHRRYFGAARRQIRRERSDQREDDSPLNNVEGREPPPDEHLLLSETMQQLFAGLDGQHQAILMLGLDGHDTSTIAQHVGCTERTVQRVLQRTRHRLEQWAREAEVPETDS